MQPSLSRVWKPKRGYANIPRASRAQYYSVLLNTAPQEGNKVKRKKHLHLRCNFLGGALCASYVKKMIEM